MLRRLAMLGLMMGAISVSVQAQNNEKTTETMTPGTQIQEVKTPGGLTAWLVESHSLPMVGVELNFRAGAAFEPADKHGISHLTASLIDEGAGAYKAKDFKEELEAIGARLGAGSDAQDISINLTTLSDHAARAFDLLGMAVRQPRFDADAVARMKDGMMADIRQGDEDPSTVAWRLFRPAIYGQHPYANSGEGTLASVDALTVADARAWHGDTFTKQNMVISVVGDITPAELAKLLDKALGGLPDGHGRNAIAAGPQTTVPAIIREQMKVPQGTVLLGHLGLPRSDPDYYAMLVMNEILGGGVLTSRLGADVREKHGLVYDVRSVNAPLPFNGMFYVSLATDNNKVAKALGLVRKHLKGIRAKDVTAAEFDDAKAYLVGSFPLRLDSNQKLLNMLAVMQSEGLGADYLTKWPQRIGAVTREDIRRVANKLIHPDAMTLVVVGDGKALDAE